MMARDWLADLLILVGALCVLAGVYLLAGLAVALIGLGGAVGWAGVRMGR